MLSLKSELRPGFSDLFSENRFFSEYLSFTLYGLFHRFLPNVRCRGRAVMLIPGFLAGDLSFGPQAYFRLAQYLRNHFQARASSCRIAA
jgi:hypothetical protein